MPRQKPTPPKPPKQGQRIPLGPSGKGPLFRKNIRDMFKRKNWKKRKPIFTKTIEELKDELTEDQYRKLKYDKHKG